MGINHIIIILHEYVIQNVNGTNKSIFLLNTIFLSFKTQQKKNIWSHQQCFKTVLQQLM